MPRKADDLYPEMTSFPALHRGYREARMGKRDKEDVLRFAADLEANLLRLRDELRSRRYEPAGFDVFHLFDPKEREIHAPYFRDRVVHRALHHVLEPLFERGFIHDSYACRPGRGTHAAVDRLQAFMRNQDTAYYLECDIRSYFDSVDHDIMLDLLSRRVTDEDVLWLVRTILDDYDGGVAAGKGMPIGTLYSQLFANIYLDRFDHFVKQSLRVPYYVRYMDDFILLSDSKADLHDWRETMQGYLRDHLELSLPREKAYIEPLEKGATWLGYRVFPQYRLLRKRNKVGFRRRMNRLKQRLNEGEITYDRVRASIDSWRGHASHAATTNLLSTIPGTPSFRKR